MLAMKIITWQRTSRQNSDQVLTAILDQTDKTNEKFCKVIIEISKFETGLKAPRAINEVVWDEERCTVRLWDATLAWKPWWEDEVTTQALRTPRGAEPKCQQ